MTNRIKFCKQAIQCTDATTGKVGDFLYEKTEAGLVAVSPVFDNLPDLFDWLRESRFVMVRQNGLMPWYMDKQELEALYLEWVNDWLSPESMAAHYSIGTAELIQILDKARELRESEATTAKLAATLKKCLTATASPTAQG